MIRKHESYEPSRSRHTPRLCSLRPDFPPLAPWPAESSFFRSLGSNRGQSDRVRWLTGASSGFHVAEKDAVAVNVRKGSTSRPHEPQYRLHHDKCGSEPQQFKSARKERTSISETSSSDDDIIRPRKTKAKVSLNLLFKDQD